MREVFTQHSIARRLHIGVGLAAGLVLGLTLWFNYRNGRTELEQQTNTNALGEIRTAARHEHRELRSRPGGSAIRLRTKIAKCRSCATRFAS